MWTSDRYKKFTLITGQKEIKSVRNKGNGGLILICVGGSLYDMNIMLVHM